jgi:hypothetical protein
MRRSNVILADEVAELAPIRRVPSLAELAGRIDAAELSAVAKRDLKSALSRVASWMGETPATVPADPIWLHRRMSGWTGPRFGVSAASFSVVLSQFRRALRYAGPRRMVETAKALGPHWQRLADAAREYWVKYREARGAAPGQNWLLVRLGRFMRWCEAAGIAPDNVDDAVIAAYIDAVAATALRGNIAEKERGLRKAWNHAEAHIAGWPAITVATRRVPSAKPVASLPDARFAPSFVAELDAYREHLGFLTPPEAEDRTLTHLERLRQRRAILHDGGAIAAGGRRRRLRPLAPASLYWHRRVMVMTASALVAQGVKPIEAIRGIADVASLEGAACVIDCYEARRSGSGDPSTYPSQLVTALLSIIARCGIILPAADRGALTELASGLAAEAGGRDDTISAKNRARLAQFDDPDCFALLISSSEQEMDRLEAERRARGGVNTAMARRAEAAIGNLILCSLPVRRRTLATTDWQRNFRAPTRRGGNATLVYHPDQTKTRRALQVVLDPWRWRLVELYWRHYRPCLAGEQLLQMIVQNSHQQFHDRLVDPAHAGACDTSCPDCLRSYSNLAYHNLLDWRLAVDMANLALDSNSAISLSSPLWVRVADLAATTLEAARPGFSRTNFGGLPGLSNGTEAIIVTHPLWLTDRAGAGPEIAAAWDDAERNRGLRVDPAWSFISVFEALRRPA